MTVISFAGMKNIKKNFGLCENGAVHGAIEPGYWPSPLFT